ncbi:plasmid mobilization relaxosome protein MobC, partial [Streptomyces sp. NPDC056405]
MTNHPQPSAPAPDDLSQTTKPRTLRERLHHAFGRAAPGGASSTPSPTQGRSSGVSAPGVAETVRRQGAPDQEVGAEGGPDPDTLHAVQQQILRPEPAATPAAV